MVRPRQLIEFVARTAARTLAAAMVCALAGCAGTTPSSPAGQPAPPTPEAPAQPAAGTATQPAPSRGDASGATLALLQQSERAQASGSVEEAITYTERAIRISPRQPDLWIRRATLELASDRPSSAIQYANKALSLAGDRVDLQRDAWLVIANARDALGEHAEADRIRERWRTYRG